MIFLIKPTSKSTPNGDPKNPPTLCSGVLAVLEAKEGGFFPPYRYPLALGALLAHAQNINPFKPYGPSRDPFGRNGS